MSDRSQFSEEGQVCPAADNVAAYLQSELSVVEKTAFEKHCESCASCRTQVDQFRAVLERMRAMSAAVPTRDLAPVILARIPQAEWIRSARWLDISTYVPQFGRIAAVLLLLLSAVAVVYVAVQKRADNSTQVTLSEKHSFKGKDPRKNEAIAGGLAWLAANQEADGSWNAEKWGARKDHTAGITALSLLAFMGRDSIPGKGLHAEAIRKGIGYLVAVQDASGRIGPVCDNAMYNHGMATVALMKARHLATDKAWKDAGDRAVDFVCSAQNDLGGWGYLTGNSGAANTSVTVWQLQALMLAEGMGRTDLSPRIDRSLAWLRSTVDGGDRMGYSREGESSSGYETLTAAGILCLVADDSRPKDCGRTAQLVKLLEAAAGQQCKTVDYYRWYFVTHALQAAGGTVSREVAGHLQDTLIAQQASKGPGAGSWEPGDRWSPAGGRIYATSMAVLSLE
ncbi:MAG: prenyltransferase/squalene oxidase repeat-containing protein [bacterium]